MQEFMVTAYGQMRLVSAFEIVNQMLSMALVASTAGRSAAALDPGRGRRRRGRGDDGDGARLNGLSHWVMWELTSLFEQVGTVQDGITTLSRAHAVSMPRGRSRWPCRRRDPLRGRRLRLSAGGNGAGGRRRAGGAAPRARRPVADRSAGEKIGWWAARVPARAPSSTCCCASGRRPGPDPDRRPGRARR